MRIGPLEVIIILAVAVLVMVVMRIARLGVRVTGETNQSSVAGPERPAVRRPAKGLHRMSLLGAAFILAGILLLFGAISLFRWVVWSYSWAFIAVAIGLAMVFFSRRR